MLSAAAARFGGGDEGWSDDEQQSSPEGGGSQPPSLPPSPPEDSPLLRVQMATVQRFVSVDVLVTEIQKQLHLLAHGGRRQEGVERICSTEQDVLTLHAHYRAQRPIMGLWEFCTWLRVLIGADMLMATVQGLSGQVAGASPTRGKPHCGTCV